MGLLRQYTKQQHTKKRQEAYKLTQAFFNSPAENKINEATYIAPQSLTCKLHELFALELIGYNGKLFTEEERIYFDERAGIYEYEAGMGREQAESRAYKDLKAMNIKTNNV